MELLSPKEIGGYTGSLLCLPQGNAESKSFSTTLDSCSAMETPFL